MHPFRYITLFATALLMTACSSDNTLEEEKKVDIRQPMVFGTSSAASETTVTRAVNLETEHKNFKVGVWKNFGSASQQNVMNGYEVDYIATTIVDDIYSYNWHYEGINGQLLRYWDLSAFPYEFRAVAPNLSEATITDAGITVNKTFTAQTYIDGAYNKTNAESEPYVVSHVKRQQNGTNFEDYDVIKNVEINADAKANATREVHMPFHHLISKVGFRIFIDDPQPTSPNYAVKLKNIEIYVVKDGFISASNKYTATNEQGLGKGTFSDNTTQTEVFPILMHGEYADVNLRDYLSRDNAYDLSPNYMQQIPQKDLKIRVKLTMETYRLNEGSTTVENTFTYNQLLSLDKTKTTGDDFTWDPDTRYIYYLHIPNLHGHVIYLNTCEILPWDEVQTTDIPIEL